MRASPLAAEDFPPMLLECWFGGTPRLELPDRDLDLHSLYGRGLPFVDDGFCYAFDLFDQGRDMTEAALETAARKAAETGDRGPEIRLHYTTPDYPTHPLFMAYVQYQCDWDRRDEEAPICGCGKTADAIYAWEGRAIAGYGSCFDTDERIWTSSEPPPEGVMCDACMKQYDADGRFEFVRSPFGRREKELTVAAAIALFRYGAREAITIGKWIDGTLKPEDLPPILLTHVRGVHPFKLVLPPRTHALKAQDSGYLPFIEDGAEFIRLARENGRVVTDDDIEAAARQAAKTGNREPEPER